jgi:hypothetical protein
LKKNLKSYLACFENSVATLRFSTQESDGLGWRRARQTIIPTEKLNVSAYSSSSPHIYLLYLHRGTISTQHEHNTPQSSLHQGYLSSPTLIRLGSMFDRPMSRPSSLILRTHTDTNISLCLLCNKYKLSNMPAKTEH